MSAALIPFPKAKDVPQFAMAFTDMMFAHAEFEEQVRTLEAAIKATAPARLHFARLLRLLNGNQATGLGDARQRPKRMAKLIKARPGLVTDQETKEIIEILKAAVRPCDQRNLLVHGRWWRFDPKTSAIRIRSERAVDDYTETKILRIADELKGLALELSKVRSGIENRRGDHDIPG